MTKMKSSDSYGRLVDEVSDISVTEHLITFIQYYDHQTRQVETSFLSCQNIQVENNQVPWDFVHLNGSVTCVWKLVKTFSKRFSLNFSSFFGIC